MAENNQTLPPTTLVVFGISGDLSKRYLLPALAVVCQNSGLTAGLKIIGVSRRDITKDDVLDQRTKYIADKLEVIKMDLDAAGDYTSLKDKIGRLNCQQTIFYLAVPPAAVLPIVAQLGQAGLNTPEYKLLMEKPFGTDLASARQLIEQTNRYFSEDQVFRIDHYLAKEMAQNIAVFLGSNALFRDVWNNQFIDKIEIEASEEIGIEGRIFFDQTGALRDFVQSHLLQLTALTLMEPCPDVFDFSQMQNRRLNALKLLEVAPDSDAVTRGQYEGYPEEVNHPGSVTETFVSLILLSKDPKWQGVPIRLTTGKRLNHRLTEIRIFFKQTQSAQANLLRLRIQPKEGIELELWIKEPGYDTNLQKLPLAFSYQRHFGDLPNAYEQVLVDSMRSRSNLFASSEEVVASWEILQPVLDRWQQNNDDLKIYPPGSSAEKILD